MKFYQSEILEQFENVEDFPEAFPKYVKSVMKGYPTKALILIGNSVDHIDYDHDSDSDLPVLGRYERFHWHVAFVLEQTLCAVDIFASYDRVRHQLFDCWDSDVTDCLHFGEKESLFNQFSLLNLKHSINNF